MSNARSIWTKIDRYPPLLVRLLAVGSDRRSLLTDDELVRRAGGALTLADVQRLSYTPSWDGVSVGTMRSFVLACGVDFSNPARMRSLNRALRTQSWVQRVRRDHNFPTYRRMLAQLLTHAS